MNFIFTKEQDWLKKWDEFLQNENRGSHLSYSNWLQSYKSYGFDFEVAVILDGEKIIGGFGAVIAKSLWFKFYIVPHGPIFVKEFEYKIEAAITEMKLRAKKLNCCYAQFSLPISDEVEIHNHVYQSNIKSLVSGTLGNNFKYIYSSYGINWVDFNTTNSAADFINKLSIQVRRNINLSYKNEVEISFATNEQECKVAYGMIEQNAIDGGYSVRSFDDFKATILGLIKDNRAFLMVAKQNNEIKGTAFFVDCGNYLTYISGGTKKEKPDLKLGYLLHWEIIKKSFDLGYNGYNISMGGSKGVVEFKSKFNTKTIRFDNPYHHFILKPVIFKIYLSLNTIFTKNKKLISTILKKIK